jgi:hypothetical protein
MRFTTNNITAPEKVLESQCHKILICPKARKRPGTINSALAQLRVKKSKNEKNKSASYLSCVYAPIKPARQKMMNTGGATARLVQFPA